MNNRPHGHIARIKNSFDQYTYLHQQAMIITTLIKRKKIIISFLRIEWSFICKTLSPFTQGCFVQSLVDIGPVVLENLFEFRQFISHYLPLENGMTLLLNKLRSPLTKDDLRQFWLKLAIFVKV